MTPLPFADAPANLQQRRMRAAERFGHGAKDSLGRVHRSIPAAAILAGWWGKGDLVRGGVE